MLGQPDVVPERRQGSPVELHTDVDAVVAGTIRRETACVIGIDLIKGDTGASSLCRVSCRATKATVVESYTYRPVDRDRQVGLELIDRRCVIIDLNRDAPCEALVIGGGHDNVTHSRAVILPRYIERVVTLRR